MIELLFEIKPKFVLKADIRNIVKLSDLNSALRWSFRQLRNDDYFVYYSICPLLQDDGRQNV